MFPGPRATARVMTGIEHGCSCCPGSARGRLGSDCSHARTVQWTQPFAGSFVLMGEAVAEADRMWASLRYQLYYHHYNSANSQKRTQQLLRCKQINTGPWHLHHSEHCYFLGHVVTSRFIVCMYNRKARRSQKRSNASLLPCSQEHTGTRRSGVIRQGSWSSQRREPAARTRFHSPGAWQRCFRYSSKGQLRRSTT